MEKRSKKRRWGKLKKKLKKLPSNVVGGNKAIPKMPINLLDQSLDSSGESGE